MREILFRGKSIGDLWKVGYYTKRRGHNAKANDIHEIHLYDGSKYVVDPNTLGQYTGHLDISGKQIFEGDVVEIRSYEGDAAGSPIMVKIRGKKVPYSFVVEIRNDGTFGKWFDESISDVAKYKVLGNIYDDPELRDLADYTGRSREFYEEMFK